LSLAEFDTYYVPINSLVDILDEKIKAEEGGANGEEGKVIEISHYLNNCLMDIICLTAFGMSCPKDVPIRRHIL
jgi:hypothetical protein